MASIESSVTIPTALQAVNVAPEAIVPSPTQTGVDSPGATLVSYAAPLGTGLAWFGPLEAEGPQMVYASLPLSKGPYRTDRRSVPSLSRTRKDRDRQANATLLRWAGTYGAFSSATRPAYPTRKV